MQRRLAYVLGTAISLVMIVTTAVDSQAIFDRLKRGRKNKPEAVKDHTFSAAGIFTGSLEGEIILGEKTVIITDETTIYVSEEGTKNLGWHVTNAALYACGKTKRGVPRATLIVVRPEEGALERPERAVERSRNLVRSRSNPNVGYYDHSDGYTE